MICSLILLLFVMFPSIDGNSIVAADETVFVENFINVSANATWTYHNDRVFERGLRMYGQMRLDQNVHFFISSPEEYEDWVVTGDVAGLLYDFPKVGELDIYYRHDIETELVFVIYNNNTVSCIGTLNVVIDRTGPVINYDIGEHIQHAGTVRTDFEAMDEHFRVQNLSIEILGELVWYVAYTSATAIPRIADSYYIDTTDERYADYEDKALPIYFIAFDEGNNSNTEKAYLFIDNLPPVTNPNGEFNWFGIVSIGIIIAAVGIPVGTAKWVYENKLKRTKQERVDAINKKAAQKKAKEKKEQEEKMQQYRDKKGKRKRK